MNAFVALALSSIALVGCVDEATFPDDSASEVSLDGKSDGSSTPRGMYRDSSPSSGQFKSLEIRTNLSFHRECPAGSCPSQVTDGTVAFTSAGTTSYIRFVGRDGQLVDRYAFSIHNRQLTLRAVDSADEQTLTRDAARCTGTADSCSRGSSESTCEASDGCSFKESCTGYAASCSSMSQYDCGSQQGCYWLDLGDGNGSCSGSTNSCSSESLEYSCKALRGCSWEEECTGYATSCSSLDEHQCSSQPGCHLESE